MKSAERFLVNPIVVHMKWARAERLDVFEWSHHWLGIEQFDDQATNRLLIAVLEEYEDSGTTQEDVKKTTAKMLPSTKHCMCTICIVVVNDYNKLMLKLIEYQWLVF